jgi:hypothetical protein
MIILECGSNFNEIINMNTAKLTARYKGKYTHDQANIRDLEAEKRAQMEAAANTLPAEAAEQQVEIEERLSGTQSPEFDKDEKPGDSDNK